MSEPPIPPEMQPYGRHVLICVHGDCAPPGRGAALSEILREHIGQLRKLRNPERLKISLVDCLGVCAGGPIVAVYPDGIWYHHVDEALMLRIAKEHILGGRPVEERIFHRLYPPGAEPAYPPDVRGEAGSYTGNAETPQGGRLGTSARV